MNSLADFLDFFTALASLSAVVVAILSFQTYRRLRPSADFKRRQDEHMNHFASVILDLFDHLRTFAFAQVNGNEIHPYRYYGARYCSKLLSELLDECARLDLTRFTVGQDHPHRWELYEAFRCAILEQQQIKINTASPKDFTAQHFTMGMLRLAALCREYEPLPLKEDLDANIDPALHEEAWGYLKGTKSTSTDS